MYFVVSKNMLSVITKLTAELYRMSRTISERFVNNFLDGSRSDSVLRSGFCLLPLCKHKEEHNFKLIHHIH